MPKDDGAEAAPGASAATETARLAFLERVPLALRMVVYGTTFLSVVLVGLPWLFHRIDVHLPAVHVEVGWLRYVGGVFCAICVLAYVYASYVLTTHGRGAYVEFDPPRRFVSTGPYRWVRNPIAVALLGALLGEAVMLSSTGVMVMFVLALGIANLQVVCLEEPLLRQRFGRSYEAYRSCVPRWIPRRPGKGGA